MGVGDVGDVAFKRQVLFCRGDAVGRIRGFLTGQRCDQYISPGDHAERQNSQQQFDRFFHQRLLLLNQINSPAPTASTGRMTVSRMDHRWLSDSLTTSGSTARLTERTVTAFCFSQL